MKNIEINNNNLIKLIPIFAIAISFFAILHITNDIFAAEQKQIIIQDNIKNYTIYGSDKLKPGYADTYNPTNLFDNLLPNATVTSTMWSDYGDAGFIVNLKNQLNKPICSAEIFVFSPKNSPFLLTLGNQAVEGVLDSTKIPISFEDCVKNLKTIKFDVKAKDKYTSLQEIKLFTEEKIPPIEPPICPPKSYWDDKLKICVEITNPVNGTSIVNSTISMKVSNSTINILADSTNNKINNTLPVPPIIVEDQDQEEDNKDQNDNDEENNKN